MTKSQIILLQTARRQLRLDEAEYRLILRNVGGVDSCKDLSNQGFEDVMAFFEGRGFEYRGQASVHFRRKLETRGRVADARQLHKIAELASQTQYKLPGLCLRFSDGRTDQPEQLAPAEAHRLIEMLKAVLNRQADPPRAQDSPLFAHSPATPAPVPAGFQPCSEDEIPL